MRPRASRVPPPGCAAPCCRWLLLGSKLHRCAAALQVLLLALSVLVQQSVCAATCVAGPPGGCPGLVALQPAAAVTAAGWQASQVASGFALPLLAVTLRNATATAECR